MVNLNIKKSKQIFILLALTAMLSITAFNPNIFNFSSSSNVTNIDTPNDPIFIDEIIAASYSSNYGNSGENLNISLHQSKIDVGTPLFEITNASDNNNNTFYIDSPFESTFNSTLSEIFVEDIYAPNKSLDIELETGNTRVLSGTDYYFSFTVPGDGFLNNFSLCLTENYGLPNTDAELTMDLYRSTLSGVELVPLNKYADLVDNYFITNDTTELWHNFTVDQSLDASDTTSNTFFIMVHHVNPSFSNLEICGDSDVSDPDGDKTEVYYYSGGWININFDFACTMDFSPLDNTPLPSQIGLKINSIRSVK